MNKLLAGLGIVTLATLAFVPQASAAPTFFMGGGMGSAAFGTCGSRIFLSNPVVHSSPQIALPSGTYRAHMGSSTSWQVRSTDLTQQFWGGFVKFEVIEVAVFGAETVRTTYARSVDTTGEFGAPFQDNQEFGSFVVAPTNTSKFISRITAIAAGCAEASIINARLELVAE